MRVDITKWELTYLSMSDKWRTTLKVKDKYLQEKETEFELDLSYEEYLRENYSEPTGKELDEMEEDSKKSSTGKNHIIVLQSLNNLDYNPKYGA